MTATVNVELAKATLKRLERAVDDAENRLRTAEEALERFEKECTVLIGMCEFCGEDIWEGDRFNRRANPSGGRIFECWECVYSYRQLLTKVSQDWAERPETMDADDLTVEDAQKIIDDHLAAGGSLDDKMVSP